MADNPEVPDIKKVSEQRAASFAWTPANTVAKSAASAAVSPGQSRVKDRNKIALVAGLLTIGGLAFAYAAFRFAGTTDGGGGGSGLGGVASTMKIHFSRQKDPTGFIVREKAPGNEKMRFDLIAGATGKSAEDKSAGASGDSGEYGDDGGAPMNYAEGSTSRGGGAGNAGGGSAAGAGKSADKESAGRLAGGGAARIGLVGSVKFQGMQRVSPTAGFRSIGRRGTPSKVIHTTGPSAKSSGAATKAGATSGGSISNTPGGNGSNATSASSGRESQGGTGSAGGGGGGSGGGGAIDMSGIIATQDNPSMVADLLSQAKDLSKTAEDEKKKAMALKALGQDPQAAYHYDKYKKAKNESEQKQAEADQLLKDMNEAANAATAVQPE